MITATFLLSRMARWARRSVALFTAICLIASGTSVTWAQSTNLDFDITAPTINHTPPISKGVAGDIQTITAEISDNQSVERALLIFRNSTADFFSTVDMAADVTNVTWLAKIETSSDDEYVDYYIIAQDTDGNRVQKGSESNPLTIELQQSQIFGAVAPAKNNNNQTKWIGVGIGVLVAMALIAASGGSDDSGGGGVVNSDEETTCCTITFTVPNVDTE